MKNDTKYLQSSQKHIPITKKEIKKQLKKKNKNGRYNEIG